MQRGGLQPTQQSHAQLHKLLSMKLEGTRDCAYLRQVKWFKHYYYYYDYRLQQGKGREKEEPLRRGREK